VATSSGSVNSLLLKAGIKLFTSLSVLRTRSFDNMDFAFSSYFLMREM